MKKTENYKSITDAINTYMDNDSTLQMSKNDTAISLCAYLIFKTGLNVEEGIVLMDKAKQEYIKVVEDLNNGKLNTEFN